MADPLSIAVSAVSLAQMVQTVFLAVSELHQQLRDAPRAIDELRTDVEALSVVLEKLTKFTNQDAEKLGRLPQTTRKALSNAIMSSKTLAQQLIPVLEPEPDLSWDRDRIAKLSRPTVLRLMRAIRHETQKIRSIQE